MTASTDGCSTTPVIFLEWPDKVLIVCGSTRSKYAHTTTCTSTTSRQRGRTRVWQGRMSSILVHVLVSLLLPPPPPWHWLRTAAEDRSNSLTVLSTPPVAICHHHIAMTGSATRQTVAHCQSRSATASNECSRSGSHTPATHQAGLSVHVQARNAGRRRKVRRVRRGDLDTRRRQ